MRGSGGLIIKKLELLSPSTFIPQIESRIAELEEVLKTKQFAVKKNPSGLVRIVRQQNYLQFYKRSSPSDVQGTYMPRFQEKLARALIQNDYDQKSIPAIEAEIKELKDFIKAYKEKCSDTVYKKLASTRQEFAWEHFGMMDDQEYAARATEKLGLYAENGFFPGKNLIITMETSAKPLSSKLLKSLIKTYLK